jgi:hypothetical protein
LDSRLRLCSQAAIRAKHLSRVRMAVYSMKLGADV